MAGWLAEAPSGLTEVVAVSAHSRTGSPGATDLLPAQVTLAQVYAGSAGRTADGAGGAGSPGQVVKEAHSPSWPHPPALLRYLGKYQASGLKMSGVFLGASGGRGLKLKTNFTSSAISSLPQSLTEKAVELVSMTYLPMYTHIPTKSPSWISTPGCKGSACIVSSWCLPRPAPLLHVTLTTCREPSKHCSALLATPGWELQVGVVPRARRSVPVGLLSQEP